MEMLRVYDTLERTCVICMARRFMAQSTMAGLVDIRIYRSAMRLSHGMNDTIIISHQGSTALLLSHYKRSYQQARTALGTSFLLERYIAIRDQEL